MFYESHNKIWFFHKTINNKISSDTTTTGGCEVLEIVIKEVSINL